MSAQSKYGKRETVAETVSANMGILRASARKYFRGSARYGATEDDLAQMGAIGLAIAHETWDPSKGAWSTWAVWKIRGAISNELRRYGQHERAHLDGRWNHVAVSQLGRADAEEAAVEAETGDNDRPELHAAILERNELLLSVLDDLPKRDARVLRMRYFEQRKLREISDELGISKARVGQLIDVALGRARAAYRALAVSA